MKKEELNLQIQKLAFLVTELKKTAHLEGKIHILNTYPIVKEAILSNKFPFIFTRQYSLSEELVIKSIIAIEQAEIIFNVMNVQNDIEERLKRLLELLIEVELFYEQLGGIIGYHLTFLALMQEQKTPEPAQNLSYTPPLGKWIDQSNILFQNYIKAAIAQLDRTVIFLPIGGAGDRLNLIDEVSKQPLPAAMLPFLGRTLLEGLIRDLQSYEYLFYKIFDRRIEIPIALMTSQEKNNHDHIQKIITSHDWFGRSKESFHFFIQPLVPMITEEGNWSLSACLTLSLKPGGHGVMWKLAQDRGLLDLFQSKGYHQAFVRQINNPLAGTDAALLALIGMGSENRKSFGFLSCERLLNSSEGTNALIEKKDEHSYSYCISNIEYTDFDRKGIGEVPSSENSAYSKYPSNTNILYVNINAIQNALQHCAIPGALINMKSIVPFIDTEGNKKEMKGGRIESTMQNIADYLIDTFSDPLSEEQIDQLQTFILFSERIKTISTTKKSFKVGDSPLSTPEQAFYDLLYNNINLFRELCFFDTPELSDFETYLSQGPNCLVLFHPALGPLYAIIAQKIQRGYLATNSELQLEIIEVDIQDLHLEGSLSIESSDPLDMQSSATLPHTQLAKCTMKNVRIHNKGINRTLTKTYWKNQITHHESVKIVLNQGSEFYAENLILEGSHYFEVPAHHLLTLTTNSKEKKIEAQLIKITKASWHWNYQFDDQGLIRLYKLED